MREVHKIEELRKEKEAESKIKRNYFSKNLFPVLKYRK
jgi:hypothetical protein